MEAIATLIQKDPFLALPKSERIAARKARKERLAAIRYEAREPEPEPVIPEAAPVVLTHVEMIETWVAQHINKYKAPWFSIVGDVTAGPKRPSIEQIQRAVCKFYGVTRTDMLSDRRQARIVLPRQIAVYICRRLTTRSLPEIGRKFGGRDHTTQLHSARKIEGLMAKDAAFAAQVEEVVASLGGDDA